MSDGTELEAIGEQGGRELVVSRSDNVIAMLLEAARDPTIDAGKVETMANLAIKLQDRERETQFAQDFAAAIMEMPRISKRGTIVIPAKDGKAAREQGKFAHFEDIDATVRPILASHNLVITFKLGNEGGMTTATPILTHRNGYRDIGDALRVPPDTSGSKNAAQAIGSSSSYAKRYAMCAALNIITEGEDTDGRSYPLPDDPLNDRQQRLIAEAEASHANGEYAAWFGKQLPKDKAWLITMGVNARLGGGAALPGSAAPERAEDAPAENVNASPPPPPPPAPPPAADPPSKPQRTPRQWVDGYKVDLGKCTTVDRLDEYIDGKREALARLESSHPDLHKEAVDAGRYRRDEIEDGRLV